MQLLLIVIHLIGAFITLSLGIALLLKSRSGVNIIFSLLCFCVTIWIFGTFEILLNAGSPDVILSWDRFVYLGVIPMPLFAYHFSLIFSKAKDKFVLYAGYFSTIIFLLLSRTDYFAREVNLYPWGGHLKTTALHNIFLFFFLLYTAITLYKFSRYYFVTKNSLEKNQTKYILLSFYILTLGSLSFAPAYGINILPVGDMSAIIFSSLIAYSIIRYRLLGVRVILSNIYLYTLTSALAYAYFYLVLHLHFKYLGGPYTAAALSAGVTLSFIFSFIFLPFVNYIRRTSDTIFFKGYNPARIIKDLTIKFSKVIAIDDLLKILIDEFKKVLSSDQVGMIVFRNGNTERKNKKRSIASRQIDNFSVEWLKFKGKNNFYEEVESIKSIKVRDELKSIGEPSAGIADIMDKAGIKIISPLIAHEKLIGTIVLGDKISQEGYTQEDIEFLEIISSQAAVAIENALLYKEIGEMNKNLQKKVEEKTTELRDKNEYLEKLLVMRSEFLDIASHQLRTPVTVIRGMTSMILEGGMPENKINEFLKAMLDKSGKLAEIINDILRASEMDSEKVLLKFTKVDLNTFLTKLVDDKQIQAKTKEIGLKLSLPKTPLPAIQADERYLEQSVGNLINNSFQYTPKNGKVEVSARLNGKKIEIRVSDTGIGIPANDLPKLFSKFSRASNAIAMYTDGTGLGLFIVKRIIEEHKGGKVCVEKTVEGKGTTFLITLAV